jgi:hypothetical protein
MTDLVIIRTYPDGDTIALFPEMPGDMDPETCLSYQHSGQHGSANYHGVMKDTRKSTQAEKQPLIDELESIGYELKEVSRESIHMFLKRLENLK